jgi:hypothetical protein
MCSEFIKIRGCVLGAALLLSFSAVAVQPSSVSPGTIPGDSIKKRDCACEVYQALADREFKVSREMQQAAALTSMSFGRKKKSSFGTRLPKHKTARRKVKKDRISRCWK